MRSMLKLVTIFHSCIFHCYEDNSFLSKTFSLLVTMEKQLSNEVSVMVKPFLLHLKCPTKLNFRQKNRFCNSSFSRLQKGFSLKLAIKRNIHVVFVSMESDGLCFRCCCGDTKKFTIRLQLLLREEKF